MREQTETLLLPDSDALPLTPEITSIEFGEIEGLDAFYYDAETDTYWARIESRSKCVPLEVVSAVATVSKTNPGELPPLYYEIGPDAFDALADLTITDASLGELHVSVTYVDYEVTVHADGVICIRPPPNESAEER